MTFLNFIKFIVKGPKKSPKHEIIGKFESFIKCVENADKDPDIEKTLRYMDRIERRPETISRINTNYNNQYQIFEEEHGDAKDINFELHKKNRIAISELQFFRVHIQRYLLCRVITKCIKINALTTIVEDPEGEIEKLSLYNWIIPNKLPTNDLPIFEASHIFPIGTILTIRNPFYDIGSDGSMHIRSENPDEVDVVKSNDKILDGIRWESDLATIHKVLAKEKESAADNFWELGNKHFQKNEFSLAINEYSNGIELAPHLAKLYASRAEAYLKLKRYHKALDDAEKALRLDQNYYKARICKGQALYNLKDYEESKRTFNDLLENMKPENSQDEQAIKTIQKFLSHAQILYSENKHGIYDYIGILNECMRKSDLANWTQFGGPRLDHADYKSDSIEIRNIGAKGCGWVANRDIPQHTLLMVSKAFGIIFEKEVYKAFKNFDIAEKNTLDASRSGLILLIAEKLLSEPELGHKVYQLYAGPDLNSGEKFSDYESKNLDIERIQNIVQYNSIQPDPTWEAFRLFVRRYYENNRRIGSGLWRLPSYYNHSCVNANTKARYIGDLMFIRAQRLILRGEMLTIPYVGPMLSYERRLSELKKYGIKCQCQLCNIEQSESWSIHSTRSYLFVYFIHKVASKFSEYHTKFSIESVITEDLKIIEALRSLRPNSPDLDFPLILPKFALFLLYELAERTSEATKILEELYMLTKVNNVSHISNTIAFELAFCYWKLGQKEKAKEYFNVGLYELVAPIVGDFKIDDASTKNGILQIAKMLEPKFIADADFMNII
ncbi:4359_t:CDS:1 [Ambispora leptoticha]|uniref:4359_t:CDS:1 n=1 Tax=Ambispora leptoticha TaxID=144679 RepID=A0A9N9GC11_9GLOM|nr:4359_t:CDS:1 [Ambispora leptoticha]